MAGKKKKVEEEEILEQEEMDGSEEVEADEESVDDSDDQGIIVGDPKALRPVELPLVVKLPADASKAQEHYAKILNGYAYKNPEKWEKKKDKLISKLKALKNAPDPVESNLKVNNSGI